MQSKLAPLPQHQNLPELHQDLVQVPGMVAEVDGNRDGYSTVSTEVELIFQSSDPTKVNAVGVR
jgi:hypothetical protein